MNDSYVIRVTWEEVDDYLNQVVSQVSSKEYSGVYGMPRGGSVLAAWLAHKLYIPLQYCPDDRSILIDDICNSGNDIKACLQLYNLSRENIFLSTMYKGENVPEGLIDFALRVKGDNWIAFPWEQ